MAIPVLLIIIIALILVSAADTLYQNDDGLTRLLDAITGKGGGNIGGGTLRLFKNNVTVDHTTAFGALTQATFSGYAGVALTTGTWAAAGVASHLATSTYGATVTFTRNATGATETIYGWYLTDAGNTKLYACANFAAGPFAMTNNGDSIGVVPTLSYQSLN